MPAKKVDDFLYEKESYLIRGACYEVWKAFRGAFKEKVVERALKKELRERNLKTETQKKIDIFYKGEKMGTYVPDIIINDSILLEIKAKPYLIKEDEKQFWNYLKGSNYKLGFLINFGSKKLDIRRRVYDKARNKYQPQERISVNQRPHQRDSAGGFSLIELLLVIAIIAILGASIIPVASGFLVRNHLKNKTNEIVSSLRTAQINTLSGKEDHQWGIEISASEIKMYAVGDDSFDQTYTIPSSITITQTDTVFDKLTGNPDATATITIQSDAGDSNTVSVNEVGTIHVN